MQRCQPFFRNSLRIVRTLSVSSAERSSSVIQLLNRFESSTTSLSSTKRVRKVETTDKRIAAIRDILYADTEPPSHLPSGLPSGIDSADIKPVKDAIERAWAIKKMDEKMSIVDDVKKKYSAMRRALELLEKMDGRLFEGALTHNRLEKGTNLFPVESDLENNGVSPGNNVGSNEGSVSENTSAQPVLVFPRRLRIPTEAPPLKGWKYSLEPSDSSDK